MIPDYKIVTFKDLNWLVNNEGFYVKNYFDVLSIKCVTKEELLDALYITPTTALEQGYADNQLVPRIRFNKQNTIWIGNEDDWDCVTGEVNTAPTTPIIDTGSYIVTSTSIYFEWTPSTDAEDNLAGYNIVVDMYDSEFQIWIQDVITVSTHHSATSHTLTNLNSSYIYRISIQGFDAGGLVSGWDAENVSTLAPEPNIMGELFFTNTTTSSVSLAWYDPVSVNGTVNSYELQYKDRDSDTWITVSTSIGSDVRAYTVTGLTQDNSYDFRVRFYTGTALSNWSNTISATATEAVPWNCTLGLIYGTGSSISQVYDITVSGTGDIFKVEFDPGGIPDRFRLFSGGESSNNLLIDTGYIGQTESTPSANGTVIYFKEELRDAGVAERLLDTLGDRILGNGELGYGKKHTLDATLIVDGKVRLIVDAPLDSTGWYATIGCKATA